MKALFIGSIPLTIAAKQVGWARLLWTNFYIRCYLLRVMATTASKPDCTTQSLVCNHTPRVHGCISSIALDHAGNNVSLNRCRKPVCFITCLCNRDLLRKSLHDETPNVRSWRNSIEVFGSLSRQPIWTSQSLQLPVCVTVTCWGRLCMMNAVASTQSPIVTKQYWSVWQLITSANQNVAVIAGEMLRFLYWELERVLLKQSARVYIL